MAYVELPDGAEIYYEVYGEGFPMMFLHGGLGFDSSYLKNAFLPLADSDLKLVFFDLRGNGKSSRRQADAEFTVETLVEDVENLRDRLGLERIILYGHSFGGVIAQEYAARFPESLDGLILDSTYPAFNFAETFMKNLESRATVEQKQKMTEVFGSPPPDDEAFARTMNMIMPLYFHRFDAHKAESFAGEMSFSAAAFNRSGELLPTVNTIEKLSQINTPTLILAGRQDLFGLAQTAGQMREKISNSRLVVFEQSGHFPFLEETNEYLETITDFINSL